MPAKGKQVSQAEAESADYLLSDNVCQRKNKPLQ